MPQTLYERFNLPRIINAVGYATRVGGGPLDESVLDAMREAGQMSIEIDDLQAAASACIVQHTGAEAGIVTCGAGAALTLAAAACLAGNDPDRMDRLPDATDLPRNRIVYPRPGPFDYDHAIRLSGAILDALDYDRPDALEDIERTIGPKTAAIGYVWHRMDQRPKIQQVAELAHRHGLPLIVDGALSLPPVEHLRSFIRDGADLVAISGGKHLGGPQASGLLFGRRDLVHSAWVQMVDMDVRPDTWSLREWIDSGWITHPPRHGIGRSMKVSKEAIIGCLAALDRYVLRDHAGERVAWQSRIDRLHAGLSGLEMLEVRKLFSAPNGQPYPVLRLQCPDMPFILDALRHHYPKIILAEDEVDPRIAYIFPMCLIDDDLAEIIGAFRDFAKALTQM
jgi:L-seryl-tRNA(Ser) seleniumtransferase